MTDSQSALRKLLWRCRRGTKELDLLLTRFVQEDYSVLEDEERAEFDLLLDAQDPDLTEWLCFDVTPPENLANIVKIILQSQISQVPKTKE